jgi:hypothetical protein
MLDLSSVLLEKINWPDPTKNVSWETLTTMGLEKAAVIANAGLRRQNCAAGYRQS